MDEVLDRQLPLVVGAGMDFEAQLAEAPGVAVVFGQNRCKYHDDLHSHAKRGARGLISFGVAGALLPELEPGDIVVASSVITASGISRTSHDWSRAILAVLPDAHHVPIFGAEKPALSLVDKEAIWSSTGAAAIDMESGPVSEVAAHYSLPYAVLRVVLDPANRAIPPSALAGAREDGRTDAIAVLRSLLKRPQDLPGLVRLAGDNRKANEALFRCRKALGPLFGFGLFGAGEFALNME